MNKVSMAEEARKDILTFEQDKQAVETMLRSVAVVWLGYQWYKAQSKVSGQDTFYVILESPIAQWLTVPEFKAEQVAGPLPGFADDTNLTKNLPLHKGSGANLLLRTALYNHGVYLRLGASVLQHGMFCAGIPGFPQLTKHATSEAMAICMVANSIEPVGDKAWGIAP